MPFEQFSSAGREVVKSASDHAKSFGHNYIGTEHLLLGELAYEASHNGGPLVDRKLTHEVVAAEVLGRLSHFISEADALRSIGIDPERLLEHARAELGVELQIQGLTQPPRRLPAGMNATDIPDDAIPFTPRAFKVLNLAVGIAAGDLTEPRHLLQALLEDDGGLAVIVLDRLGIDLEALQAELSTSA
jgi:ATP-dependent Clp protease ATP-binding subunit ClpA